MSITQEQRAERKNHLGGSDIPAIMGFSPYANSYDIWLLKTGRVQEPEKKQDYITAGNLLENPILEWLSKFLSETIITSPIDLEKQVRGTPIVDHMDGIIKSNGDPVEVKTEGVDHPIRMPWGEVGTDEVPEYTCIQAHVHLMATEREICHVPTFIGGRGFGYFFVKRDEIIVKMILEKSLRFWEENVLADKPPENIVPSLDIVRRIRPLEGEVEIPDALIKIWQEAKERETVAKHDKEFHQAEILALLDGRESGFCANGVITNLEQSRAGYVVEPCSFRVLRLKKKK
jgi:putative phage-type endonuclease